MGEDDFKKVYWALRPKLLRYARAYLDATGAEEVVADALTDVWRRDMNFPATDTAVRELEVFAYGKLRGHISNEYRSRRRRTALVEQLALHQLGERHQLVEDADASSRLATDHWLSQLEPGDRATLLLYNAGFTIREMAGIFDCSLAAAGKRVTRARGRLRAIVERERGHDS